MFFQRVSLLKASNSSRAAIESVEKLCARGDTIDFSVTKDLEFWRVVALTRRSGVHGRFHCKWYKRIGVIDDVVTSILWRVERSRGIPTKREGGSQSFAAPFLHPLENGTCSARLKLSNLWCKESRRDWSLVLQISCEGFKLIFFSSKSLAHSEYFSLPHPPGQQATPWKMNLILWCDKYTGLNWKNNVFVRETWLADADGLAASAGETDVVTRALDPARALLASKVHRSNASSLQDSLGALRIGVRMRLRSQRSK